MERAENQFLAKKMLSEEILTELQTKYNDLLQKGRPCASAYCFLTARRDDGSPHLELVGDEFHLVTTERGLELERKIFRSANDLLYELIALDTFWMGVDFEFKNRVERRDGRRIIFAKQLELLGLIDADWAARRRKEIDEILQENPFEDFRF